MSTWTRYPHPRPDRMGSCLTRPTTPSMQRNKSQTSSTAGFLPGQQIQTLNMIDSIKKPTCTAASTAWRDSRGIIKPWHHGPFGLQSCRNTHWGSLSSKLSESSTSGTTRLRSFFSSCCHHHREPVACSEYATNSCSASLQQMVERTQPL